MYKDNSIQLIQKLNILIKKYSLNSKIREIIVNEFTKRNMKGSHAINILNERMELSTLNIDESKDLILLFVFTVGMFNALTFKEDNNGEPLGEIAEGLSVDPKEYFTKIEVQNLSDYKLEKKTEANEEIIFPKMNQVAPGFYSGTISAKYLAELDAGNEFVYNFKTQRDPVFDVYGLKRIHLNKTNVKEIVDGLLSGEQFPTTLVVNVLKDGEDKISYNEKTGDLKVISGTKNLVDGQHRKVGTSLAIESNPDLDFNWLFVVINYSEIQAQRYMVEINKQQKMKQEHVKNMDTSSLGNVVVDTIKDTNSEFGTKIKDNDKELEYGGLAKKSTLVVAIEEVYKDKLTNRLQAKPIAKHIANIMDYIIGLRVNEFIVNPEETKKTSYINHKNMFAGYVALSEKLFGDKDWEDKVEQILNNIDFSLNNPFWKDNGILDNDMKKSTRNILYKFFRDLV